MKNDSNAICLLSTSDQFSTRSLKRNNQMMRMKNRMNSVDLTNSQFNSSTPNEQSSIAINIVNHRVSNSMISLPVLSKEECENQYCSNQPVIDCLMGLENSPNKEMIERNAKAVTYEKMGFVSIKNNLIRKNNNNNSTDSYLLALGIGEDSYEKVRDFRGGYTIEEEKSERTDSEASNQKKTSILSSKRKLKMMNEIKEKNENDKENYDSLDKNLNNLFFNNMNDEKELMNQVVENLMKKKQAKEITNATKKQVNKQALLNNFLQIPYDSFDYDRYQITTNSNKRIEESKNSDAEVRRENKQSITVVRQTTFHILPLPKKCNSNTILPKSKRNLSMEIPQMRKPKSHKELPLPNSFTRNQNFLFKSKQIKLNNNYLKTNTSINTRSDSIPSRQRINSISNQVLDIPKTQRDKMRKIKSHSIFDGNNILKAREATESINNIKATKHTLALSSLFYEKPTNQPEAQNKLQNSKGKIFVVLIRKPFIHKQGREYIYEGLYEYLSERKRLIKLYGNTDCPNVLYESKIRQVFTENLKGGLIEKKFISGNGTKGIFLFRNDYIQ